jgi:peptide/nickel transport system permease protein
MITLQAAAPATRARGPTAEALSRLLHHRSFLIGGALVLLIVFVAIFADLMAPFDPLRSNVRARLRPRTDLLVRH